MTSQLTEPWAGAVTTVIEAGLPLREDQLSGTAVVRSCRTVAVVLIATGAEIGDDEERVGRHARVRETVADLPREGVGATVVQRGRVGAATAAGLAAGERAVGRLGDDREGRGVVVEVVGPAQPEGGRGVLVDLGVLAVHPRGIVGVHVDRHGGGARGAAAGTQPPGERVQPGVAAGRGVGALSGGARRQGAVARRREDGEGARRALRVVAGQGEQRGRALADLDRGVARDGYGVGQDVDRDGGRVGVRRAVADPPGEAVGTGVGRHSGCRCTRSRDGAAGQRAMGRLGEDRDRERPTVGIAEREAQRDRGCPGRCTSRSCPRWARRRCPRGAWWSRRATTPGRRSTAR